MKERSMTSVKYMVVAVMAGFIPTSDSAARGDDGVRTALEIQAEALQNMISASGDASLRRFIDEHVSEAYRRSITPDVLMDRLKRIRSFCARAGIMIIVPRGNDGMRLTCESGSTAFAVDFRVDSSPPHRLTSLEMTKVDSPIRRVEIKPITWANLKECLEEEERAGFSGAVVIVRDGQIVVDQGYGQADRERGVANTSNTLFGIGSIPIGFTRAAILKLVDLGKIRTSDRITKYFSGVPEDKKSMTLDHLMTGRSGLPNYHHVPGKDDDYDLTWIDRRTAIERIFAKELLFAPGEGRAHSHSAWTLLAAVVEVASKEPYGDFLQKHFFSKAGMERTGLYQHARDFKDDDIATGYGYSSVGTINSPKYWGKTSWLMVGAGAWCQTRAICSGSLRRCARESFFQARV